jgi:hypothetical protein
MRREVLQGLMAFGFGTTQPSSESGKSRRN